MKTYDPNLTLSTLKAAHDFDATEARVASIVDAAADEPVALLRFLSHYASWNGYFGAGVATLAGKIARSRHLFVDPDEPVHTLADRSVFVASYFFDAARDEFDDGSTGHRDTHRCLAQAMVAGVLAHVRADGRLVDPAETNRALAAPEWLLDVEARVARGYGAGAPDDAASIFTAMGYHLGSEVLADAEFSVIDHALSEKRPALVKHLKAYSHPIGGQTHNAWHWLRVHSGHGGAVEEMHFEWAVEGVRRAFAYLGPDADAALHRQQVLDGFARFAADHAAFFDGVSA